MLTGVRHSSAANGASRRRPEAQGSSLYPNEVAADFAFIPFGGGMRKCVGDQFALLEATVGLAMLLRWAAAVCAWASTAMLLRWGDGSRRTTQSDASLSRQLRCQPPSLRQLKQTTMLCCRKFEFQFVGSAADVGMASGATIHTANGLKVRVARRKLASDAVPNRAEPVAASV